MNLDQTMNIVIYTYCIMFEYSLNLIWAPRNSSVEDSYFKQEYNDEIWFTPEKGKKTMQLWFKPQEPSLNKYFEALCFEDE